MASSVRLSPPVTAGRNGDSAGGECNPITARLWSGGGTALGKEDVLPDRETESRYDACLQTLKARGQEHVLRHWSVLTEAQRAELLTDIESIPWDVVEPLIESHVLQKPRCAMHDDVTPPNVYPHKPDAARQALYRQAVERGQHLLRDGRVAAFTVAGGQGTRLGFDGPKGAVAVTPVGDRTLFELFAETVKAAQRRYDAPMPWYIMTSPANHGPTVEFFREHAFFGLPESNVVMFRQGMLPVFDPSGRLLLDQPHRLALAPDGHGGSLKALVKSGALKDMQDRGIRIISYFQVDNPLVKPFDALFLGLHSITGSEMSIKVTPKTDDLERVGNLCMCGGRLTVVEYSDFPSELAHARNPDGSRKFDSGNLAIHLLNVDLVDRIIAQSFELPFRRADKKVAYIDENGKRVDPPKPNAIKLETFVFDAVTLAGNPLVLEVDRAEEFSPVKNATSVDSLDTSKRDQVRRACRWLEAAGVTVPRKPDGEPDVTVAIAPAFALDAADVIAQRDHLPALRPGDSLRIE